MSYDITDGVGGLWEQHQWNDGIILNTEPGADRNFVESIPGLHKRPDWEDPRIKRPGRLGETSYPSSAGGKTVSYVGALTHNTLVGLRQARTLIVAAFAVREGYMDVIPHPDVGGPTARYYAEVLDFDPPEKFEDRRAFDRAYQLDLRMSDPRFYFPSLAVDETGNPAAVTNDGTAPADPVVTVSSALGDVSITDGTHTLNFQGVPSGDLVIDFAAKSAKVGSTEVALVVATSDWWDSFVDGIAPGASVSIAQTGGTGVRVQFTPAVWA